jgi:hypothetical protein
MRTQRCATFRHAQLNYDGFLSFRESVAPQPQIVKTLNTVHVRETSTFCGLDTTLCGFGQRNDESLDHVGQFGKRQCEARDDNANSVLSAENHNANDALDNSHLVNAVEKQFDHIVGINHVNHLLSPLKSNSQFVAGDSRRIAPVAKPTPGLAIGANLSNTGAA